jgi:copper homeostasis protein (lipoprotein)
MAIRLKAVLIGAVLGYSLSTLSQTTTVQQSSSLAAKTQKMQLLGTWQGTTPCADCSGIITTLTLYQKTPDDPDNMLYRLRLKYIDRGSFTEYGMWKVLHGMPDHPDATVYQLKPEKGSSVQYYWRVDDDTLQQLDGEMKPIDSKLNFILKRIGTSQKAVKPN